MIQNRLLILSTESMSKVCKSNFLNDAILIRIFKYLHPKTLFHPVMAVCKHFNRLCCEKGEIIASGILAELLIPYRCLGPDLAAVAVSEKLKIMKDIQTVNAPFSLFSYFTDGGVYDEDTKYFIGNIFANNAANLYSTVKSSNVHVKSLFSEAIGINFTYDSPSSFAVKGTLDQSLNKGMQTYRLPIERLIGQHDPTSRKQFAILKYFDLNRNHSTSYTCLLQSFALFISMEEIDENHPVVQLFNDVNKLEQVEKLGFPYTMLQDTENTKVVEFNFFDLKKTEDILRKHKGSKASLNGVYPFLWGQLGKTVVNYLNIIQKVGFRHLLLKLIDSEKILSDTNINCFNINVSGVTIKLRHFFEE